MIEEAFYNIRQETLPVQVLAISAPYLEPKLFFLPRSHFAFQSERQPHYIIFRNHFPAFFIGWHVGRAHTTFPILRTAKHAAKANPLSYNNVFCSHPFEVGKTKLMEKKL
jgi:hypothetical protein